MPILVTYHRAQQLVSVWLLRVRRASAVVIEPIGAAIAVPHVTSSTSAPSTSTAASAASAMGGGTSGVAATSGAAGMAGCGSLLVPQVYLQLLYRDSTPLKSVASVLFTIGYSNYIFILFIIYYLFFYHRHHYFWSVGFVFLFSFTSVKCISSSYSISINKPPLKRGKGARLFLMRETRKGFFAAVPLLSAALFILGVSVFGCRRHPTAVHLQQGGFFPENI